MRCSLVLSAVVLAAALACGGRPSPEPATPAPPPSPAPAEPAPAAPPAPSADTGAALNALFAEYDDALLARSPMMQSERGIKTDYGKWDDFTEEQAAKNHEADTAALAAMRARFTPA
ncbi:MAG: hypothetical protein ACREBE_27505, partial [bacterium]